MCHNWFLWLEAACWVNPCLSPLLFGPFKKMHLKWLRVPCWDFDETKELSSKSIYEINMQSEHEKTSQSLSSSRLSRKDYTPDSGWEEWVRLHKVPMEGGFSAIIHFPTTSQPWNSSSGSSRAWDNPKLNINSLALILLIIGETGRKEGNWVGPDLAD